MNTRKFSGLALLIILCCASLSFAQIKQPVQASPSVKLFKTQTAPPSSLKQIPAPSAPAPLSNIQLQSAVTELQKELSATAAPATNLTIKKITLTTDRPMVGSNYFEVYKGNSYSRNNYATIFQGGAFYFYFNTVPGKTYLVDLALSTSNKTWSCFGAISGQIQTQDGHLMAGFKASTSNSCIYVTPAANNAMGHFFTAQLIPVD